MDMNFLNDEQPQGETLEDFLPEIEFQEEFEIPHATVICAGGQVVNIPVDPEAQTNGLPGATVCGPPAASPGTVGSVLRDLAGGPHPVSRRSRYLANEGRP
jgi:hypothetical protein